MQALAACFYFMSSFFKSNLRIQKKCIYLKYKELEDNQNSPIGLSVQHYDFRIG